MKQKLALYLADRLFEMGITDCFTVTGGGAMHLNDAFGHKEGMHCVYNHHEQACAVAAEGYARIKDKPALVCVTSGPGGTNAITGVIGGWLDSIPMLIISGQVKRETTIWSTDVKLRQLGDQEFNIVDVAAHMTKYAVMVTEPESIAYHLEKAMYLALNGRPGPVWLDIPLDVQGAVIETDELRHFEPSEVDLQAGGITMDTAQTILDKIAAAKRPVVLLGTAVRQSGALEKTLALVEKLGVPVVTAWNAHDAMPTNHPLFCGKPGTVGTRGGNFVVQGADLLLSLGCRLNIRMISYNKLQFAQNAYKIIVDIDEGELEKPTIHADMPIHADLNEVVACLLKGHYAKGDHGQWLNWAKEVDKRYPAAKPEFFEKDTPLNPYAFLDKLFNAFGEDEKIICGNGSACVMSFQTAIIKEKTRLFTNSGCASMGYGFPAAMGVCVAANNGRVICIDGDGSFQMNIQELQTVVQNRMNIKILILNNDGYHSIRQTQTNLFKPPLVGVSAGNGVSFPNLEKLAYAYDLPYVRIDSLANADAGIEKMLKTQGPILVEAVVDPSQNFEPKLSSKVLPDGRIVSAELDDMFPFLPREEYEKNHRA